jgi:hypothetical protein
MQPLFFSVGEASQLLGTSEKWVYKHIHKWECAFKLEGKWFIDRKKFLEWLSQPTPVRVIADGKHGLG